MRLLLLYFMLTSVAACGQQNTQPQTDRKVGGGCECCEGIYEQAPDFNTMNEIDTLPGFNASPNKMLVYGTIYKIDGKTPVAGVIFYIYHTDQRGYYTPTPSQTGCAKRHGELRGWIKTNAKGEYRFYTQKPAAYPDNNIPSHIHPVIKEPGLSEYYIDEFLFDDDPFLTTEERNKAENRGGNGIIKLSKDSNGMLLCKRDIILGKNIPGY